MIKVLSLIYVKYIDEKYMMKLMRMDYLWLILFDFGYFIIVCLMIMVFYVFYKSKIIFFC